MTETHHTHHRYSLWIYLLLANGITWLGWIPGLVARASEGYIMPMSNFDNYAALLETGFANPRHMLLGIGFQLGVYGPLIGGLVAVWLDGGKVGLSDLWGRITRWNIAGRWYLNALAITFLITGIPVGIFALTGSFTLSTFPITYVVFAFLAQLLTSGLGEEPGWRGFLLPRLQQRFEGEKSIWVLGLIWAVWHYPLVIDQTLGMVQNVTTPQLVITIVMSLAGQTMTLIGLSFVYVWLYNQTKSVFLMIFFHALSNLFVIWLPSFLTNPQALGLLPALMPWAVVVFLKRRLGKEQFPGTPL